jgi:hypothetical protein
MPNHVAQMAYGLIGFVVCILAALGCYWTDGRRKTARMIGKGR